MGLITPKVPRESTDKSNFDSSIAVLSPVTEPSGDGPDANVLRRTDFPQRDLPPISGNREAYYQTVFRQSVLNEIHAHGKSSMEAEVCGVLIGDVYSDRLGCWAYIENCIQGNNALGKQTEVTITSETWTRIHETLEAKYPGKKIIGWYHTHPGFGIFLSGMDVFIQNNFFNQPWQIATVYDPSSGDEGTFVWRGGKSVRETILVENDTGAPLPQPDAMKAVDELTKRMKRLERRLDVVLTGFLTLILVALVSPLIVFALAPNTVRKLIIFRPAPPPAATTNSQAPPPVGTNPAGAGNNVTPTITGGH